MTDTTHPIAIIGIGCRFPGGANSPSKLWELLKSGRDAWTPVPPSRWNEDAFHHPDPEIQGMHNHRGGHFIDHDLAAFDAGFFGMAPAECEAMDPQHRIQLEVACEALENAGLPLENLEGSDTAVHVATFSNDYNFIQHKDVNDIPKYTSTGVGTAIAANRISYLLDLRGPSITVDTGCSGSIVAIHNACQSLRSRECSLALAGGVNLLISPDLMLTMSLMRCWNDDGKCHSFDDRGFGYGRGEGAAMIVLKRLDDAIRDGDHIRAVIRNTGVNSDGKTNGIMVPKSAAQKDLIEKVYRGVNLDPKDTGVVEAHATGTAVGDPNEVAAIRSAFRGSNTDSPLYIGSIKPNIGHLESASGIASIIKGVLMLENGMIPPTINVQTLKAGLRLDEFGIVVPRHFMKWPEGMSHRLSVNSFGYGGTNAHAILEAAEEFSGNIPNRDFHQINGSNRIPSISTHTTLSGNIRRMTNGNSTDSDIAVNGAIQNDTNGIPDEKSSVNFLPQMTQALQILPLSAKSEESARTLVKDLLEWCSTHTETRDYALQNLAYTLSTRRSLMQWRVAFPISSLDELVSHANVHPVKSSPAPPRMIFVFTGQGAQWYGMGRGLMCLESPFRTSVQRSDKILQELGADWSLMEELLKDDATTRVNESKISQPATTALQVALVDLLCNLGVKPEAVVGHSSGEIAAAYAAGALDHDDAIKVAYFRGRLNNESLSHKGAMLAVGLGEVEVQPYLSAVRNGKVVIACANSPSSSTVSGDEAGVADLETALKKADVFARRLKVDRAYHSHHMQEVAGEYLRDLDGLRSGELNPDISFVSSVTGLKKLDEFGPQYWVQNLVSKVRFSDALNSVLQATASPQLIIELGPHHALEGPIRQILSSRSASLVSQFATLLRGQDAKRTFANLSSRLFELGCRIDLGGVNSLLGLHSDPKVLTTLPTYPWNYSKKYWHESRQSKQHRFRKHPYHDLLGIRIPGEDNPRPIWRHFISLSRLPWLQEHSIDSEIIFPASGYICMVIEAVRQLKADRQEEHKVFHYLLREISFVAALVVPETGKPLELQLRLTPIDGSEWEDFKIISVDRAGGSTEHCRGSVRTTLLQDTDEVEGSRESLSNHASLIQGLQKLRSCRMGEINVSSFYQKLQAKGNGYGPNFATLEELSTDGENALSKVRIPDVAKSMPGESIQSHVIHPAVLDALLHPSIALVDQSTDANSIVTASIGSLSISNSIRNAPGLKLNSSTKLTGWWAQTQTTDIQVFQENLTENLEPVLQMHGVKLQVLGTSAASGSGVAARRDMTYQLKWGLDVDFITSVDVNPPLKETEAEDLAQAKKLLLLNQASALYIDNCLQKIKDSGVSSFPGHHQWLFNWMKRFRGTQEYANLASMIPESNPNDFLQTIHSLGIEGEVLTRIGENLSSILTGAVDPLTLITEEGLLWRMYADDSSVRCYSLAIKYLRHLVFKNPNMAVLEVGAGTGSATEPILSALSEDGNEDFPFQSYDFTDVSTAFFERSGQRLQKWENNIAYRRLNIQEDAVAQGFQEGVYDLILASNVLHLATSMDKALSRIRRLLKPSGRMILIETTKTIPFYNACLGVLPGWWAGANDGRPDGPFLSVPEWDQAFRKNGLGGADLVANDFEGEAYRSSMVVSAPVAPDAASTPTTLSVEVKILLAPTWNINSPLLIHNLVTKLGKRGFTVTVEPLSLESKTTPNTFCIVLDDASSPMLTSKNGDLFKAITQLVSNPTSLLWISAQEDYNTEINPEKGLINGFARVARVENKSLQFVTLDVQENLSEDGHLMSFLMTIEKLTDLVSARDHRMRSSEQDYEFRSGRLYIPRVIPDTMTNQNIARAMNRLPYKLQPFHQVDRPLSLSVEKARFIDKMEFREDASLLDPLEPTHLEITVQTCGVNFKDVLLAGGHIKKKMEMCGEFAGIVVDVGSTFQDTFKVGDRVCGYGAAPYSSRARVHGSAVGRLPDGVSFTTGASIPMVYSTAWYGLMDIARLERGQTVLIHSAAGGVGQAAIAVAKWVGAKIFATVGSATKKQFLVEELGIPEEHIFSSRLRTFKEGIHRLTNGSGVDVVLNSLSGQALHDSWACVARFGTFVELGKADVHAGTRMSMAPFNESIRFASIDMTMLYQWKPEKVGQVLQKVLPLIADRELRSSSPITVLPMDRIGDAFRTMQGRSHMGKIVLEAGEDAMVEAPLQTLEKLRLASDGTYIIAGGLGGVGFEIAQHFATNGAKHIVLISRRQLDTTQDAAIRDKFHALGAEVRVLSCDITILSELQKQLSNSISDLPPVRGVIQSAMMLQDRVISQMNVEDFAACISPKVVGSQNLVRALESHPLQFVLLMSSAVGVIGVGAEANYAAGNTFLNSLAKSRQDGSTRFIVLCPGVVDDVGVLAEELRVKKILQRQGLPAIKVKEIIAMVDYVLGEEASRRNCNEIFSGFDYRSLFEAGNEQVLESPMFSYLLRSKVSHQTNSLEKTTQSIEDLISDANTLEEVATIISKVIAKKVGTLVAIEEDNIDSTRSVAELGIDSLVVVELKNWIGQIFRVKVLNSEVSEAPNIGSLARLVATRSPLVVAKNAIVTTPNIDTNGIISSSGKGELKTNGTKESDVQQVPLPKQPVPDLDASLENWLLAICSTTTNEEYAEAQALVEKFRAPGGQGRKLQARLVASANDPTVDNWQEGLYNKHHHLKLREPLVPQLNFFGTHPTSPGLHSAAERAAIISTACRRFKESLEAGEVDEETVNGRVLNKEQYQYLFNATREPRKGEDAIMKYPENDYIVAFRYGRAFKVALDIPFEELRSSFQYVIDSDSGPESWVGVLTTDERDSWEEARRLLANASEENSQWLHTIEAAAFVIYLDDVKPNTARDRGHLFQHAIGTKGFNRWSDKTLQFAICDDGMSAAIGEHSMIDGYTMRRLNSVLIAAITNHVADVGESREFPRVLGTKGFAFDTTQAINDRIAKARKELAKRTAVNELAAFETQVVSVDFFRQYKVPAKSVIQVANQLASRKYFGFNPIGHETVSLAHFLKGRVECGHILWPAIQEFCTAASESTVPANELRGLFLEAVKSHAINLMRCSSGQGIDRHLLCLEWSIPDGDPIPELFASSIYKASRPGLLMTDCLDLGALECGALPPRPGGIWIHFEPEIDKVRFSVWGPVGQTDRFKELLEESVLLIRDILES
ncbi:hypothetical protein K505DRAFT_399134 [Melanomma pulvis-pyrius CBS 109.77]|uniref:Uncharacterized protein n=1 Tax=Melanomma pulvis-pyrius CBS 109.77 TaxID=1314802 RepID=A0A6A6XL57_9PLEO|nr:hypothetical protein K505DRAFT_399134 [Melanomma pulvis-pyrius CBS 109.77]